MLSSIMENFILQKKSILNFVIMELNLMFINILQLLIFGDMYLH